MHALLQCLVVDHDHPLCARACHSLLSLMLTYSIDHILFHHEPVFGTPSALYSATTLCETPRRQRDDTPTRDVSRPRLRALRPQPSPWSTIAPSRGAPLPTGRVTATEDPVDNGRMRTRRLVEGPPEVF